MDKAALWTRIVLPASALFLIAVLVMIVMPAGNDTASNAPIGMPVPEENEEPLENTPEPVEKESPEPVEDKNETLAAIKNAVELWLAGGLGYEDAIDKLEDLEKSIYSDLSLLAKEKKAFIIFEEDCNNLLAEAKVLFDDGDYSAVFEKLNSIDAEYTGYNSVEELYYQCENAVIDRVAMPRSLDDFEAFISLLNECLTVHASQALENRKQQLADELVVFIEVTEIIQTATVLYDSGEYAEAFITLALGIEKYPVDERLARCLVDYHDHYIISITKEAVVLCEEKEYKVAQKLVETAIEEYDCIEFQLLLESIKEQKNPLYRWKNNVVDRFVVMAQGWESEEFDVKQAAATTGSYIVKSGEKLFLGDYSEERVVKEERECTQTIVKKK